MTTRTTRPGDSTMTITDVDHGYRGVVDGFSKLDGRKVVVGWFDNVNLAGTDSSVLRMAVLSEFGSRSENMPASAPLRSTFDDNEAFFMDALGPDLYRRLVGGEQVDVILDDVGKTALKKLQDKMSNTVLSDGMIGGTPVLNKKTKDVLRELSERADFKVEKQ